MTEADVIQPSASIASTGKSIRYIGNWAYAYSGAVDANNDETDLINTTSGAGIIVGEVNFNYLEVATEDFTFTLYLNDMVIYAYTKDQAKDASPGNWFPKIIIPPLTKVKITAQNITDTEAREMAVALTGRVYGAE